MNQYRFIVRNSSTGEFVASFAASSQNLRQKLAEYGGGEFMVSIDLGPAYAAADNFEEMGAK